MRITPAMIEGAYQYTNRATSDRELRLRALKIPAIENLGATLNQFDCIDLSDNDIRKINNFPLLPRLKRLLLNNNRISHISPNLDRSLPNLEGLIMTNNYIQELGDIDALANVPRLDNLSLINNPVTKKEHYRPYVIHRLPRLRLLDFRKVKLKERKEANSLFAGHDGQALANKIGVKSKVFTSGVDELQSDNGTDNGARPHKQNEAYMRQKAIDDARAAVAEAQDVEAINRINNLLRSGYMPGARNTQHQKNQLVDQMEDIASVACSDTDARVASVNRVQGDDYTSEGPSTSSV